MAGSQFAGPSESLTIVGASGVLCVVLQSGHAGITSPVPVTALAIVTPAAPGLIVTW